MFPNVSGNIGAMDNETRDAARQIVKREMSRQGMTAAVLARRAEIDPKTLRAFLRGERWPQMDNRAAISRALGWEADELDYMDANGEHRRIMKGVDRETGLPAESPWSEELATFDLQRGYSGAINFAMQVAEYQPVREDALNFMEAALDLYVRASALLRASMGGDGNADSTEPGGSAPTSDSGELSEEPFTLRSVAKPGGLEPEDGDLNEP